MWEELSKRHVKRFLCFVLLYVWVLVFIPHCVKRKKRALKAILSFWSLWCNLWRGTARGLFSMSGWSASDCERLHLTLYKTLAFSYIRQEGKGYDLLFSTALPYSNSPVKTAIWLCVKLFACLEGPSYFFYAFVRVCVCFCACSHFCQDIFKVEGNRFDRPSTTPLS